MPESNPSNREPIIAELRNMHTSKLKILDVGFGYGNFGELIKLDLRKRTHLTGIEIFPKYKNSKWNYYDNIIIGDILTEIDTLSKYDVILAIDIIEHIKKKKALCLLDRFRNKCEILIISIPIIDYPQGEVYGNKYEAHLATWNINEFLNLGGELLYFDEIIGIFKFGT